VNRSNRGTMMSQFSGSNAGKYALRPGCAAAIIAFSCWRCDVRPNWMAKEGKAWLWPRYTSFSFRKPTVHFLACGDDTEVAYAKCAFTNRIFPKALEV